MCCVRFFALFLLSEIQICEAFRTGGVLTGSLIFGRLTGSGGGVGGRGGGGGA